MHDLNRQREKFKEHVATFTDYGNIKILDFKRPGSNEYRIRFLFENDYCRLHISGDLGELTATNYNNMTYEKFGDFVHDPGYFEEKIDCHSRDIYTYDLGKAKTDLQELFRENGIDEIVDSYYGGTFADFKADNIINDILEDFDKRRGIGSKGYETLPGFIADTWEYVGDIGKERTGILELYLLAFKLAQEQLGGAK